MAQNSKISIIEGYIAPEGYSETEKITHQTKRSEKWFYPNMIINLYLIMNLLPITSRFVTHDYHLTAAYLEENYLRTITDKFFSISLYILNFNCINLLKKICTFLIRESLFETFIVKILALNSWFYYESFVHVLTFS